MRSVCDQDFNWATRRWTPIHLRALSGRANEFRQDVRNQYLAYSKHSVSGVTMDSASHQRAQRLGELRSAKRIVRALATCRRTSSTLAICPRKQSSQATLSKMRANFSWMAVKDNVNLACDNGGRAPRFSGMQKGFPLGWTFEIMIASSAALAISSSRRCIRYGWAPGNCRVFWITLANR